MSSSREWAGEQEELERLERERQQQREESYRLDNGRKVVAREERKRRCGSQDEFENYRNTDGDIDLPAYYLGEGLGREGGPGWCFLVAAQKRQAVNSRQVASLAIAMAEQLDG